MTTVTFTFEVATWRKLVTIGMLYVARVVMYASPTAALLIADRACGVWLAGLRFAR